MHDGGPYVDIVLIINGDVKHLPHFACSPAGKAAENRFSAGETRKTAPWRALLHHKPYHALAGLLPAITAQVQLVQARIVDLIAGERPGKTGAGQGPAADRGASAVDQLNTGRGAITPWSAGKVSAQDERGTGNRTGIAAVETLGSTILCTKSQIGKTAAGTGRHSIANHRHGKNTRRRVAACVRGDVDYRIGGAAVEETAVGLAAR